MATALQRLQSLPEAFTFSGFCRLTRLSNSTAAVWLARWKAKGLIEPAGERAGIYFNRIKTGEVDGSLRVAALQFVYPSTVLSGESVLRASGWITQIPASLQAVVMTRRSYISLHGVEIHPRPIAWFKKVHPYIGSSPEKRVYGLRALPPALALADLYGDPKAWHPDPDDLYIPDEELGSVEAAARLLKVELPAPLADQISELTRARA
jgi:hypothetical protein